MKKTLLITTLVLLGALGFTINAQAATCSDVIWSASALENNPAIADHCLEVVEKNGMEAVKMRARVVRQTPNTAVVQWAAPDGSYSAAERVFPAMNAIVEIGGQEVRIRDLAPRQEVNVYVPAAGNWSLPVEEPVAAAAPPPWCWDAASCAPAARRRSPSRARRQRSGLQPASGNASGNWPRCQWRPPSR